MRKRLLSAVGVLALLALPAFPQTNPTGTISGKVVDEQGLAVPGATVAATSPALQGSRTATTSANGDYILPFLPPGQYTISVELPGFQSVRQSGVNLAIGETKAFTATLKVSSVSETITVTGEIAGQFNERAKVATNFKQDLIEKLPVPRTFQQAALLTPGVEGSGPSGNTVISGAMSYQNVFMINGVVVQDNIRNTAFNLFIEDALQETTTSTAAISAQYGRFGGGVVEAVTKSGGNRFSGSFRTTFENDAWRALTPYPNDKTTDKVIPVYEATLGGPILKDRLWFFGATRLRDFTETRTTGFTNLNYDRQLNEKRYEGKLTWSVSPKHTFKGAYSYIDTKEDGNSFSTIMDRASLVNRALPQDLLSLNYTGILSSNLFVEAQYSSRHFTFKNSGSQYTDLIQGTLLLDQSRGSARYNSPTFCGVCDDEKRDNNNVVLKGTYFLSTANSGSHNIVLGMDMYDDKRFANNHQSGSDYRVYTTSAILQGEQIFPVLDSRTFIRWTPILVSSEGNKFRTWSVFLNDTWTFNQNFTFNVGVRWDKNDGTDAAGTPVVKDSAFSPRISASYDPTGDGTWKVNASYAKYVTSIANSVGDNASAGGQPGTIDFDYLGPAVNTGNPASPVSTATALQTLWDWFFANGGTNRPTRGAPSIPGVTARINESLASPYVDEFVVGLSRKLGSRGSVRVDGVYRKFGDFYSSRRDLSTGKVTDPNGRVFDLTVVENTNDLERKYKGLNFQANYRPWQSLDLGGNYTLAQTTGNFDGENAGSGPVTSGINNFPEYFNPAWSYPIGDLANDVRHRVRTWATWTLPIPKQVGTFYLGGLYRFASGQPYGSAGTVDTRPYVTNPGYQNPPASVTYYFENRDTYRMANLHQFDLALNWQLGVGKSRAQVFFRGVLENAFNQDALVALANINTTINSNRNVASLARFNPFTETPVEGVNWTKGSSFGKATSRFAYQTPRTVSFSVGVRF